MEFVHHKNIDIKSIIIGALLTSTIFLGVAATSPTDKWDNKQKWQIRHFNNLNEGIVPIDPEGWEPFGWHWTENGYKIAYRKRIK